MYNIAICDDDTVFAENFQTQLTGALKDRRVSFRISAYADPDALLNAIAAGEQYQLLFMDILFHHTEQGIRLASSLKKSAADTEIIFISTTPDFALASFDAAPLHYLLKPIADEKLAAALERFLNKSSASPAFLSFDTARRHIQIPLADVTFIEIFLREIVIHKTDGTKETCVGTLSDVANRLPASLFVRPHRSYLVNLNHISEIIRYQIRLSTKETVPIARRMYAQVQQAFIDHAEQKIIRI